MKRMDLNADMGEGFGRWSLGADEELIKYVSSANIACGFHAGDWEVMARTVALAVGHKVAVGAHPSYPDLQGFGRRRMEVAPGELSSLILYQLGALWAIARAAGTDLTHVKPHGALYNDAMRDATFAEAVVKGVKALSSELTIFCLPGSSVEAAAHSYGLPTCAEGFSDRLYEPSGLLANRQMRGSVLDTRRAVVQSINLANGKVTASDGSTIIIAVQTLCIHGDSPGAPAKARAVREALEALGYRIGPPGTPIDS